MKRWVLISDWAIGDLYYLRFYGTGSVPFRKTLSGRRSGGKAPAGKPAKEHVGQARYDLVKGRYKIKYCIIT